MSNTKRIMEQAQSFASAWSLVGGAFDGGDGKKRAEEEKAELQRMVEELETALNAIPSSDNTIDGLSQYVEKLESHLAALEKQEPVAWLDKSTEERPGDTVWLPCDLKGMDTSWLVPLYAAQPVTAPVRLTDEQLADAACNANSSFRAIETAVLRANGFKIDHPEHAIELVGLRGCTGCAERVKIKLRKPGLKMNQQKLDQHIDALLRAAGSALRHYTMQKSLDDMRAAMKAAVEELANDDSKRLDFLESNQLETDSAGDWNEEPTFGVHRVSGGRNDRNWHCLGRGETLRAAIDAAMQPPKGEE